MVSVKFDALAKEGIDPEAVKDDVLAAGGSLGERDPSMTGVGIRRSKPLAPDSFVLPSQALESD